MTSIMERIRAAIAERAAKARALIEAYSNPIVVVVVKEEGAEAAAEAVAAAVAGATEGQG